MNTKYWIVVVSKDHCSRGVSGGFIQACHGKKGPLLRMKKEDWILVYSSKVTMTGNDKCQAFTAIGQVIDNDVYQFQMSRDFIPFRRNIKFYDCQEISILPLINELDFIQNKQLWGYPFRYGFLEIKENDFKIISSNLLKNEVTR